MKGSEQWEMLMQIIFFSLGLGALICIWFVVVWILVKVAMSIAESFGYHNWYNIKTALKERKEAKKQK